MCPGVCSREVGPACLFILMLRKSHSEQIRAVVGAVCDPSRALRSDSIHGARAVRGVTLRTRDEPRYPSFASRRTLTATSHDRPRPAVETVRVLQ